MYMDRVSGYVLAGGQSTRMGEDKAVLSIGGQTFVERAANALSTVARSVTVVGLRGNYDGHLKIIPDALESRGSIVGLYTALADCGTEFAAVLACDLPFANPDLLKELVGSIGEFEAAMPMQQDGRLQPLCAVYRRDVCLPHVERILASDNWRLQQLGSLLRVSIIKPVGVRWSMNVNTPAEMLTAIEMAGKV